MAMWGSRRVLGWLRGEGGSVDVRRTLLLGSRSLIAVGAGALLKRLHEKVRFPRGKERVVSLPLRLCGQGTVKIRHAWAGKQGPVFARPVALLRIKLSGDKHWDCLEGNGGMV